MVKFLIEIALISIGNFPNFCLKFPKFHLKIPRKFLEITNHPCPQPVPEI